MKVLASIVAVIGVVSLLPLKVSAQEDVCSLGNTFREFQKLRSEHNASLDGLRTELEIRKELLRRTVSCSVTELGTIEEKLSAPEVRSEDARRFREGMLSSIDESRRYYELRLETVTQLGLRGTIDLARELLEWRLNNLSALKGNAEAFLLWNSNQPFLDRAEGRLSSIKWTAQPLAITGNQEVRSKFEEASRYLRNAKEENEKAFGALESGLAKESLENAHRSLEHLSSFYSAMIELGDSIREVFSSS